MLVCLAVNSRGQIQLRPGGTIDGDNAIGPRLDTVHDKMKMGYLWFVERKQADTDQCIIGIFEIGRLGNPYIS